MNESNKSRQAYGSGALLIVSIYAVFGVLWILLSDTTLKVLIQDAGQFAIASMLKGWLFVAITSLLLFGLLRRFDLRPASTGTDLPSRSRRWLPITALTLSMLGASVGSIAYHWQQQQLEEFTRLQVIAKFRATQITDWLLERQHNAEYIHNNVYFAELFRRWLASGDAAAATHLQVWMSQYGQSMHFSASLFFDQQGHMLWASQGLTDELPPALSTAVQLAARKSEIRRVGPYLDTDNHIYLDFVVPIAVGNGPPAVVVLHTDPGAWLYPALQQWPVSSASAETLIFRRDGDDVLFLNELRHRQDSALKLRLPIASSELLAALFARGAKQPGELIIGVDYRGVPSVGVGYTIPGTDWFLLAKKDSTEFYDSAIKDSAGIALTCLLVLAIGGALLILQDQHAQLKLTEERQLTERAVQLQAEVLANITEGVNVVASDGRLLYVNPAFAAMFGYRDDELTDRHVAILNAPTTEHTAEATAAIIIEQLRKTGRWEGEILNRRKDGGIFWTYAAVSSHLMPVWGDVWLSVQYDISARKLAEAQLNQHNAMLERFNRVAIGRELDMAVMKRQINALASELGRDPPYPTTALKPTEPWQAENQQQAQLAMINLLENAQVARDEAKALAETLRESEQRLILAQEGAHVGIWEWDLRNDSTYWSPEYERLYGVPPGGPHSTEDWRSRLYPDDLKLIDAEWERHINCNEQFEVEFRIRREDTGETRWMYCVGSARRDVNGKVVILSGINMDITARKNAEFALAESEQRYRTLTDNLPGVVYRCEVAAPWRVFMISDGVKLLTGRETTEFLSEDSPLTWGELVVAEDIASVEQAVDVAIAGKQPYRIVYRIRHANGEVRWVLEHGQAIYDTTGKPKFLDGVITDMTSQKQSEQQLLKRNAELERFNRITLGREMDIIEMKKRINVLSEELGREAPYKLAFLNRDETGET